MLVRSGLNKESSKCQPRVVMSLKNTQLMGQEYSKGYPKSGSKQYSMCTSQHQSAQLNLASWSMLTLLAMMASALVTYVVNNKYIVLSQGTYAIYNNNYNYNQIRSKNNFIVQWFMREIKLKQINIFIILCQISNSKVRIKINDMNVVMVRLQHISISCVQTITFFF